MAKQYLPLSAVTGRMLVLAALFLSPLTPHLSPLASAQPRYDMKKLKREALDRGVVAIRQGEKVIVSWRTLSTDKTGEAFDIYRNGTKLNARPLKKGGTFYADEQPLQEDATYEIRGGKRNGSYTLKAGSPEGYLNVKLQKPADGIAPNGWTYSYSANDATVADVDGDGQYEIILKWDPSNARDNAHDGFTGPTLFDCYRLDGTRLWRINMGINIRSGAHYVPFIAYDLDGDGRAELIVRTADGTRDGKGRVIGDSLADYRVGAREALARVARGELEPQPQWNPQRRRQQQQQQPQQQDKEQFNGQREWARYNTSRRPMTGRILEGPEYITVFNEIGRASCRERVCSWV